jgi:nitroreductase
VASAAEPDGAVGPDGGGAPADPVRRRENRDAVAAGMQNLLLGATAVGLASYWGTGAVVEAPAVRELCGFGPADDIVGLVYLGWPIGDVPVPSRPQPLLHVVGRQ